MYRTKKKIYYQNISITEISKHFSKVVGARVGEVNELALRPNLQNLYA